MKIIVDVHERRSGIADTLAELGAEIEIAPLPTGDYAVGADTLVERKRVLDLHAAVLKGRLWPQLGKLRAACSFPYLLVEGTDLDRGPLHHNAVRGVCLARALLERFGSVAAVVTADPAEWLTVPGIGRERACALEQTFNLRRRSRVAAS